MFHIIKEVLITLLFAAILLSILLLVLCICLQATPLELYARTMNRPIEVPIIQLQHGDIYALRNLR